MIPIAFLLTGWILLGCNEVMTSDRPWLEEADFRINPALHATSDQAILFHLEPARKGGAAKEKGGHDRYLVRNRATFLVRDNDPEMFSFCIAEDELHIKEVKIKRRNGKTVVNTRAGDACEPVALEPGSYTLDIFHDTGNIGPGGQTAFVHSPDRRRYRRSQSPVGAQLGGQLQKNLIYPNFFAISAGTNDIGKMYPHVDSSVSPPRVSLSAGSDGVLDHSVWSFYIGNTSAQEYNYSRPMAPWLPQATWDKGFAPIAIKLDFDPEHENQPPYPLIFHNLNCDIYATSGTNYCLTTFYINDAGNGTFSLNPDNIYMYGLGWTGTKPGSPHNLVPVWVSMEEEHPPGTTTPLTWDFTYIGYTTPSTMPALQKGEFALYGQCDDEGTAFVFDEDVDFDQFSHIANAAIKPPRDIRAIKLGPSTYLEMFKDGQNVANIGADVDCATDAIQVDQVTLFIDVLKFIATTGSCINCNLAGADFSGDDFSGVDFSGVILTGANLTDADFSNTNLTDADLNTITGENGSSLSGTLFSGANLSCTSFAGSVLTEAAFNGIVVPTDHTCYTDLSSAILGVSTFDTAKWRYFDLSGAQIINDTGTTPIVLSTIDAPLDLSGGTLSGAEGLNGAILDGADLSCAAGPDGQPVCTRLIDTNLTRTSFYKAILSDAALNGANLSYANLSEADLSGAQLLKSPSTQQSATLEGAMLKNANLSDVDMSGANLANANWYSTNAAAGGCPGATWTGTCASGESASLNSTDLEGAYLSGLDLSDSTPQGADFAGAVLAGANFTGANLSRDPTTGVDTKFTKAYLQGADFTDAVTTGTNFTSAYVDLSAGGSLLFQLPIDNLEFAGFAPLAGSLPGCVEFSYAAMTTLPATTSGNICPDSDNGACSDTQWLSPVTPIDDATPPSTTDTVGGLANGCDINTMDINWILQ